jgi:hypothetical protein
MEVASVILTASVRSWCIWACFASCFSCCANSSWSATDCLACRTAWHSGRSHMWGFLESRRCLRASALAVPSTDCKKSRGQRCHTPCIRNTQQDCPNTHSALISLTAGPHLPDSGLQQHAMPIWFATPVLLALGYICNPRTTGSWPHLLDSGFQLLLCPLQCKQAC